MTTNFLVRGDELHTIDLGGDAWVKIRRCITLDERGELTKQATSSRTRTTVDPDTRRPETVTESQFDRHAFLKGLLVMIVKEWSDETPVSEPAIGTLPEALSDKIKTEFDRLNPRADNVDERIAQLEAELEELRSIKNSETGSEVSSAPAETDGSLESSVS